MPILILIFLSLLLFASFYFRVKKNSIANNTSFKDESVLLAGKIKKSLFKSTFVSLVRGFVILLGIIVVNYFFYKIPATISFLPHGILFWILISLCMLCIDIAVVMWDNCKNKN